MKLNFIAKIERYFDLVKREASVILARTRRCDRGVLFQNVTGKLGIPKAGKTK